MRTGSAPRAMLPTGRRHSSSSWVKGLSAPRNRGHWILPCLITAPIFSLYLSPIFASSITVADRGVTDRKGISSRLIFLDENHCVLNHENNNNLKWRCEIFRWFDKIVDEGRGKEQKAPWYFLRASKNRNGEEGWGH